jgi:hypothetical protein
MYIFVKNFICYAYGTPHLTQIFLGSAGAIAKGEKKGIAIVGIPRHEVD